VPNKFSSRFMPKLLPPAVPHPRRTVLNKFSSRYIPAFNFVTTGRPHEDLPLATGLAWAK
jgi:hypothetical protein